MFSSQGPAGCDANTNTKPACPHVHHLVLLPVPAVGSSTTSPLMPWARLLVFQSHTQPLPRPLMLQKCRSQAPPPPQQ